MVYQGSCKQHQYVQESRELRVVRAGSGEGGGGALSRKGTMFSLNEEARLII